MTVTVAVQYVKKKMDGTALEAMLQERRAANALMCVETVKEWMMVSLNVMMETLMTTMVVVQLAQLNLDMTAMAVLIQLLIVASLYAVMAFSD